MQIKVFPLYSRLADSTASLGVSSHQKETWDLLSDPSVDAVINVAMTGDGKSYAAFGAFPEGGIMALYPTNELVRDQQRQLLSYQKQHRIQRITGFDLERWSRQAKQSKSETMLDLSDSDVLLTNPDLFYYLHQGNYLKEFLKRGNDRLDLWQQIDDRFKAIDLLSVCHAQTICDPFVGSGTTLIACEMLGKSCFAFEIDPKKCELTIARWQHKTELNPILING